MAASIALGCGGNDQYRGITTENGSRDRFVRGTVSLSARRGQVIDKAVAVITRDARRPACEEHRRRLQAGGITSTHLRAGVAGFLRPIARITGLPFLRSGQPVFCLYFQVSSDQHPRSTSKRRRACCQAGGTLNANRAMAWKIHQRSRRRINSAPASASIQ